MAENKKTTFGDLSLPLQIGFAIGIPCATICALDKFITEVRKLVSLVTKSITRKKEGR